MLHVSRHELVTVHRAAQYFLLKLASGMLPHALFCSLGPILWGPICVFQRGMPGMAALQQQRIT